MSLLTIIDIIIISFFFFFSLLLLLLGDLFKKSKAPSYQIGSA